MQLNFASFSFGNLLKKDILKIMKTNYFFKLCLLEIDFYFPNSENILFKIILKYYHIYFRFQWEKLEKLFKNKV